MRLWAGLDVGGTTMKAAVLTDEGHVVARLERDTEAWRGTEAVLDRMVLLVREVVRKAGGRFQELGGVGVGLPAFLDFERGVVVEAINIGWRDVPIVRELRRRFGDIPFAVDNDANAAAIGEAFLGAGKGFSSALCLTLGTGIGSGLVVEGRLWHGSTGMAGEIGHITVDPKGRWCNCGRRGCLETIASATGIVREVQERLAQAERTLDARQVFQAAAAGDPVAQGAVDTAIDRLGFVLANVGATVNPQVMVVGGGVSAGGERLLFPLRAAFARYALPRVLKGTTIRLAQLGKEAGVIGAALLQKGDSHDTMGGVE
ncbi:MAG TPA: ROK family protein [Bacilli bacterium]|nr:ROK family protein [Bacilli bacterium]